MGVKQNELDNIYDQGVGANDPPPEVLDIGREANINTGAVGKGESNVDPSKFIGYMPKGVYEDASDIYTDRGKLQSGWEKTGNFLAQTGVKAVSQLVDMVGSATSLLTEFGDGRDYQNGFTTAADEANAWVEKNFPLYRSTNDVWGLSDASWWLQNASELVASMAGFAVGGMGIAKTFSTIGKALKIGESIEEGLTGFKLANSVVDAKKAVNFGEKVLTSGMLAFAEGAQVGRQVFNKVYQAQINQGKTEEEAQHLAAESAATTVQLNTIVNTVFNMFGGVGAFFDHEKDAVIETAKKVMKQHAGEDLVTMTNRLKEITAAKYAREIGMDHSILDQGKKAVVGLRQAAAEGIEEMTNLWAQTVGETEGQKGKEMGFAEQLGQLSNYMDYTMNQEGALNFVMGAIAGPGQHMITSSIPMHKVALGHMTDPTTGKLLGKDGKPVSDPADAAIKYYENGKRVTSAKKNRIMTENFFENIRDRVVADAQYLQKQQAALQEAVSKGDFVKADEIRESMFNLMNLNSVRIGMAEHFKETYRSIAALDNTKDGSEELQTKIESVLEQIDDAKKEANATGAQADTSELENQLGALQDMLYKTPVGQTAATKLGFSSKIGDNAYVEKAQNAIKDLEELQKIHEKVYAKYGHDKDWSTPAEGHVADFIYNNLASLHLTRRKLSDVRKELDNFDSSLDTGALLSERAIAMKTARTRAREIKRLLTNIGKNKKFTEDLKALATAPESVETNLAYEKLLDQIGIVAMEGESGANVAQRVIDHVNSTNEKYAKEFERLNQATVESEEFATWQEKNPDGKLTDYLKELQNSLQDSVYQDSLNTYVGQLENQISIMEGVHETITAAPTLAKIMANTEKFYEKIAEKEAKQRKNSENNKKERRYSENTIQEYNRNLKRKLQNRYAKKLMNLKGESEKVREKLRELSATLDNVTKFNTTDSAKKEEMLIQEINENLAVLDKLSKEEKHLMRYIAALDNPLNEPHLPGEDSTPEEPAPEVKTKFQTLIEEMNDVVSEMILKYGPEIETAIQEIVDTEIKDKKEYSLKMFVPAGVSPEDSARLATAIKAVFDEKGIALKEIQDAIAESEVVNSHVDKVVTEVTTTAEVEEDTLEPDLSPTAMPERNQAGVLSKKQISPSNSGGSTSTVYSFRRLPTGKIIKTSTDEWIESTNVKTVQHNQLLPGTKVKLTVDLDYAGEVYEHNQDASNEDQTPRTVVVPAGYIYVSFGPRAGQIISYLDSAGNILLDDADVIANFPIKITTEDGETVQYLHSADWIARKDPEAVDDKGNPLQDAYYNVVGATEEDENNAESERVQLIKYRTEIAKAYNSGRKSINTTVESKTEGTFVLADVEGVSGTVLTETNLVGGKRITTPVPLALVKQSGQLAGVSDNSVMTKTDTDNLEDMRGRLVALIRMANGTRIPVPLRSPKLYDEKEDTKSIETLKRAIELYLNPKVEDGMPFKVNSNGKVSRDSFRNFVIQYFVDFSVDTVRPGANIYTVGDGVRIIYADPSGIENLKTWDLATDQNGKLTEDSVFALKILMGNRYRSVAFTKSSGIQGLNDTRSFQEPLYFPEEGKWRDISHKSYNHFILSKVKSPIIPINHSKGGVPVEDEVGEVEKEQFYGANPVIKYDMTPVLKANIKPNINLPDGKVPSKPDTTAPEESVEPMDESLANLLGTDSPYVAPKSVGTTDEPPISLESLTELYNFTPESERNGITPREVYDYLKSIEVTHLPKDANPFKRC